MARGRMISNSLSTSEKFAALSSLEMGEFCQALYPLLVSHSDDFGRLQGDPFTVKAKCFPASPRLLDEFKTALTHLDGIGLIVWYLISGKRYIQICDFERHQQGLHRRTRSQFPRVPGISGKDEEVPSEEKGTELKGREPKGTEGKGKNPLPPEGGRITRKERAEADRILKLRFGQCRHLPLCENTRKCAESIVRMELRAKAS